MKPLSKQELREKIVDLVYDAKEYGEELHTGYVKTAEEIEKDFEKLLSTVDSIVNLILSDRKAWGKYVIAPDKYLMAEFLNWLTGYKDWEMVKTEILLAEFERQRNQGEKTDES